MPVMFHRLSLALFGMAAVLLLAACSSSSTTKPTSTPRPATPTPVPTPDTETVTIKATGVGAWQLVAIPVAVLHNDAGSHGAAEVVVHFTTHRGNRTLGSLDSEPVNLAPGETLPVAADCTDGCNGATSTDARVTVGLWTSSSGASFTAGPATYQCGAGSCGDGPGEGSATGTLTAPGLGAGTPLVAYASCNDSGGSIVGAGVTQLSWAGGTRASVSVPVIANSKPASCTLAGSTGW